MPRKLKPRRRRATVKLDVCQTASLQHGTTLNGTWGDDWSAEAIREAQQQAWSAHRESLLQAWIAEYPGTRPWAWWAFETDLRVRPDDQRGWLAARGLLLPSESEDS